MCWLCNEILCDVGFIDFFLFIRFANVIGLRYSWWNKLTWDIVLVFIHSQVFAMYYSGVIIRPFDRRILNSHETITMKLLWL